VDEGAYDYTFKLPGFVAAEDEGLQALKAAVKKSRLHR